MQGRGDFSFSITENSQLMVIELFGNMDASSWPALNDIARHVRERSPHLVVVNLVGMTGVSPGAIPMLATLQQNIRKHPAELRFCGASSKLKAQLCLGGVIRATELSDDLEFAVETWRASKC